MENFVEKLDLDFLIVGAAKAGTTSLYYYLNECGDIFLSNPKEPCFFVYDGQGSTFAHEELQFINNITDYLKLYSAAPKSSLKGEASALYLYHYESVLRNVEKYCNRPKSLKIIILLRNPIERAFSQYLMLVRNGRENLSFSDAIAAEKMRIRKGYHSDYHYMARGMYFEQVQAYIKYFEHVQIMMFSEFVKEPELHVQRVREFLNLKKIDVKAQGQFNVSSRPRIQLVNRIVQSRNPIKQKVVSILSKRSRELIKTKIYKINSIAETIDLATKDQLIEHYRLDVERLSELLNKDLTFWLR